MNEETKYNISLFHLYRFVSRFYMYLPILIIIFLHYDMSYIQMSIAIATHSLAILLFKTRLKSIMERIQSMQKIIFLGEIIKCIGIVLLGLGKYGVFIVYLAQMVNGIGFALTTSVESSLLYSLMKSNKDVGNYRRIEAKSQAYSFVSVFFAGVGGSAVSVYSIQFPIYISAAATFLSGLIIMSIKGIHISETYESTNQSFKYDIKKVSRVLFYYACNRGAIIAVFVFIMPLFLTQVYQLSNLNFGIYLALFSLTGYLAGNYIEKIMKLTDHLWIYIPLFFTAAVIILLMGNFYILFLAPVLLGFSAVLVRPLSMSYINSKIESNRSLVMSRGEQYFGFFNAVLILLFGSLITYTNIRVGTICFIGVVIACMLGISITGGKSVEGKNIKTYH